MKCSGFESVTERWGVSYPRRRWTLPVLLAMLLQIAFFAAATLA